MERLENDPLKIWHLEQFNALKPLNMKQKKSLHDLSKMFQLKKGETLPSEEFHHNYVYFLKEGFLQAIRKKQTQSFHELMGPGEIFGALTNDYSTLSDTVFQATEEALLCYLPADQWNNFVEENGVFQLSVLKLLGLRIRQVEQKVSELQFKSGEERIRFTIKRLADKYGRKIGAGFETELKLKLNQADLAKLSATSRQFANAILHQLQEEEIIKYDRRRILIKDMKRLAELA